MSGCVNATTANSTFFPFKQQGKKEEEMSTKYTRASAKRSGNAEIITSAQLTSPDAQNSHSPLLSKPEAEIKRSLVTRISPSPRLLPGPDASGRSGGASVALAGRELLAVQDYAVVVERADCFPSCGQINREIIKQTTHGRG